MKAIFSSFLFLSLMVSGCAMVKKKIDPNESHTTDGGFRFKFSMPGEWNPGQSKPGLYMAGQKSQADATTKVAIVRHGPLWTTGGKPMNNQEKLDGFKKDIEKEAQSGRVAKVKSEFSQKKYKGADCLYFEQTGEDHASQGSKSMNNDGMICLHPKRKHQFIWLAISERRPLGKPVSGTFAEDKKRFFEQSHHLA